MKLEWSSKEGWDGQGMQHAWVEEGYGGKARQKETTRKI
jgi:hypothetical protein